MEAVSIFLIVATLFPLISALLRSGHPFVTTSRGGIDVSLCLWITQFAAFAALRLYRVIARVVPVVSKEGKTEQEGPPLSYDAASLAARVSFSWISPLLRRASDGAYLLQPTTSGATAADSHVEDTNFRKVLSRLPEMPQRLQSYDHMLLPGSKAWREISRCEHTKEGRWGQVGVLRLLRTLSRLDGGKEFLWVCIPLKIAQDLLSIASHNTVHSIMTFLEKGSEYETVQQVVVAGLYVCGINVAIRFSQAVLFQCYLGHLHSSSLKVKVALKTIIAQSVLSTPLAFVSHDTTKAEGVDSGTEAERKATNVAAEQLSLLTMDAERCGEAMIYLHNTWSHPIVIVLALANMCRSIGFLSSLLTFVALLCVIPINRRTTMLVHLAKKNAKHVVTRVSDLAVALPVMRTIHAMALQSPFLSRIKSSRQEESRSACSIIQAEAEAVVLMELAMIMVYVVCYGSFFLFGNSALSVSALLPAAASLSVMRFPLWAAPGLITKVAGGLEAARRVEKFLSRGVSEVHTAKEAASEVKGFPGTVHCHGWDFYWTSTAGGERDASSAGVSLPVLRGVNFSATPGELAAITGATGSGKTAFLLAMLGELYAVPQHQGVAASGAGSSKRMWCNGSVVYCPETPWISDGTVRENITMRSASTSWVSPQEEEWYNHVIRLCKLEEDLEAMPQGDLTDVGSGGNALSGGQRARVGLARALFYRMGASDIFVFDNILSALDADLQRRIVCDVFLGLIIAKGKTLIVASSVFPPYFRCHKQWVVQSGGIIREVREGEDHVIPPFSEDDKPFSSSKESSPRSTLSATENSFGVTKIQEGNRRASRDTAPHYKFRVLPQWRDLKALLWTHFGHRQAVLVLSAIVLRQALYSITENWMGLWFRAQHGQACAEEADKAAWWARYFYDMGGCTAIVTFVITYSIMGCITCAASYWRSTVYYKSFQTSADRLQIAAVTRVFDAPPSYFDDGAIGDHLFQVLTKDQGVVDRLLPDCVKVILSTLLQLGALVTMNMIQYPPYILVVPVLVPVFYYLNLNFLRLSKQLRVLESHGNKKCIKYLKNAVYGAVTLRVFGTKAKRQAIEGLCTALDEVSKVSHVALMNDRWVALRLEMLSLFMLAAFQLFVVFNLVVHMIRFPNNTEAWRHVEGSSALAGLGALALMNSTAQLGQLCRCLGMLQNHFVSVENLTRVERETPRTRLVPVAPERHVETHEIGGGSSRAVVLQVTQLSCRYQLHMPSILTGVSFSLHRGECLGVIGRSGSGKSSLFNALLRVMDEVHGTVRVATRDDERLVNAASLPVDTLRTTFLHLVPQEPLLVEGTLRDNLLLGCLNQNFTTGELLHILRDVGIVETLVGSEYGVLDYPIADGGKNISSGQRQLLCIARALLHKPSVLLLDEVTSHIDAVSEKILVKVIKNQLQLGCGVILISHRRETVEALCHRTVLIRSGTIALELFGDQVFSAFDSVDLSGEQEASSQLFFLFFPHLEILFARESAVEQQQQIIKIITSFGQLVVCF
eukprot:gene11952-8227_t